MSDALIGRSMLGMKNICSSLGAADVRVALPFILILYTISKLSRNDRMVPCVSGFGNLKRNKKKEIRGLAMYR